ncbi:conserved hypothetical protein [Culex quinquefasciatus]|uniref:Uncharacterized protein n=1 Tax=Culex quinquefasciatus TaxID=7176 RepID=B0W0C5_CULQU|nr:uncharacterized protein LOC120413646 [Culex pipiens pallens]EDS39664.1 conserved hypothetical protein [Culex quinquefasciatus]|eukprot:XP_001842159.1 conserved hypothetical protein [Culex quinquefasciatus]
MFPKAIFICLAALAATTVYGQREASLAVIETMKSLQPLYKDLQDHVVNQLTGVKLKGSELISLLHEDVVDTKEKFVLAAVNEEGQVLDIISAQPETVNPACLAFVRSSADLNVNLAGISYTNCIKQVDESFNETLYSFYGSLQDGESLLTVARLFDMFEGENIFHDPESLIEKLNARREELLRDPVDFDDELAEHVEGFGEDLEVLKERYEECLDEGVGLLNMALNMVRTQIVQICLGQLEPTAEEPNEDE